MYRLFFPIALLSCTLIFSQQRFQYTQPKMGSPFNLIFYAQDSAKANALATEAFHLVDSLNTIFSDYLQSSELNRLSKTAGSGKAVPLSPLLNDILGKSKKAASQSKGAFDITVGPLSWLWRKARKAKQFPETNEVQVAKNKTGIKHLFLDTVARSATLQTAGMQLDLGGIAKGYAAQKVVDFLKTEGIVSALADAGGDMACTLPPPGKNGWVVGINVPENETELLSQTIAINNEAVATSGDVYQYIEHDGKKYSHIIDPRTGYGVPYQRNVTVLAKDGTSADWLATACSILPLADCKKLVQKNGAELLITQLHDNKITYFMTDGMKQKLKAQTH